MRKPQPCLITAREQRPTVAHSSRVHTLELSLMTVADRLPRDSGRLAYVMGIPRCDRATERAGGAGSGASYSVMPIASHPQSRKVKGFRRVGGIFTFWPDFA